MTRSIAVAEDAPDPRVIEAAAGILRSGDLVAFATETVYGLGADATQPDAVAKIFSAKGRPQTNPLIAHVASVQMARAWSKGWSPVAEVLAAAFWPGPLTLVVARASSIAASVSAGLPTVGLRVPRTNVARALIDALGRPVAAPSANRSEHVSPTAARHVLDDLGGRIALVLDSGPTFVGIESTVVDVSGNVPRLLRPGPVTVEMLRDHVGDVDDGCQHLGDAVARPSPGQSSRHYAPNIPCVRVSGAFDAREGDVVVSVGAAMSGAHALATPEVAARDLYALLRRLETAGATRIVIVMPPDTPAWSAVRDRLTRATTVL